MTVEAVKTPYAEGRYKVVIPNWLTKRYIGAVPLLSVLTLIVVYPHPVPAFGGLLILSLVFAVIWEKKTRSMDNGIMSGSTRHLKGVFFGSNPNSGATIGKPVEKDGHILVIGGAGTGKSSCIAIPTLKYFWESRFLAVDIKGELGAKSEREACIFNPCNPEASGYDPFYLARRLENPTSQIREIALTLVPQAPDTKDQFWIKSAQNVLTGYLLYGYAQGETFISLLKDIQKYPPEVIIDIACSDERAQLFVGQYKGIKAETLSSIMSELSNHIIPFVGDSDIESTLTKTDIITPELLEGGKNIFLQIPEHKINQWKALVTLVIQQFLTHFEQRPEGKNAPILFLLDEFARFGKIEGILHGLATLRSKNITICILIQSLAQLDSIYGQEQRKIIADNCAYKAILGATDADTQQYFSRLVGTEMQQQESFTHDRKIPFLPVITGSSTSMVERSIIKPEEFAYLKDIVLLTPNGFGRVTKQPYYTMKGKKLL